MVWIKTAKFCFPFFPSVFGMSAKCDGSPHSSKQNLTGSKQLHLFVCHCSHPWQNWEPQCSLETNCSLFFVFFKLTKTCLSFQICENAKPCEIDPLKLKEADNVETHKVYYCDS